MGTIHYRETIFTEQGRYPSDEGLIMDYAGKIESIWPPEEIRHRHLSLAAIYLASTALFAIAIITLVQALYCNTRRKAARAAPKRSA